MKTYDLQRIKRLVKTESRIRLLVLAIINLLGTIIFMLPTLAFYLSLLFVAYYKYVSFLFCLGFAWHTAKLVESYYVKNIPDDSNEDDTSRGESIHERRYSYSVDADGNLCFTFRLKDPDGSQLSRLKFMREKFFKDY